MLWSRRTVSRKWIISQTAIVRLSRPRPVTAPRTQPEEIACCKPTRPVFCAAKTRMKLSPQSFSPKTCTHGAIVSTRPASRHSTM